MKKHLSVKKVEKKAIYCFIQVKQKRLKLNNNKNRNHYKIHSILITYIYLINNNKIAFKKAISIIILLISKFHIITIELFLILKIYKSSRIF